MTKSGLAGVQLHTCTYSHYHANNFQSPHGLGRLKIGLRLNFKDVQDTFINEMIENQEN